MKNGIVVLIMLMCLLCGGCEFVGGVGTGAAIDQLAMQAERDLAENIVLLQQKSAELKGLLADAESEEDRVKLTDAIVSVEKLQVQMQDALRGVQLAQQGIKTDWKNPQAVGGFSAALVTALLAAYYRKQGKTSSLKYEAHKRAGERFKLTHPGKLAVEVYDSIGEERANLGI